MMRQTMSFWRTVVGCLPFLMVACTDDNPMTQELDMNAKSRILFAVDSFEPVSGSRTVTYLDETTNTYKVKWASGDAVGVFPYEGYQQPFVIPTSQENQSSAIFDGGYWELKEGLTYNAYYPFSDENFFSAKEDEELNIPVSYEGQSQDGSTYGVGAYDYTYSDWQTASEAGEVTFNFHHIGSLVVVHLTYPATAEFKSLALCTGNEQLIPLLGTYNLHANKDATPGEGETYVKIPFVADETSKAAALSLSLTNCNGTAGGSNTFYLMVLPVDLSNATEMSFKLTDSNNTVYNMKVTPTKFESGKKYEFSLITISSFAVSGNPFGSGWITETNLSSEGTLGEANVGKTEWEAGDEILVTLHSQECGTQNAALIYDGVNWNLNASLSYLENEMPTVMLIYAPCYEVAEVGFIQLRSDMLFGMTEYLRPFDCQVENSTISISFEDMTREYSRLRIVGVAGQTYTVTTTDFTTPAGTVPEAIEPYTLTADENGNAYLYGIFAEGATVTVKQGGTEVGNHTFTAATEDGKSYVLNVATTTDTGSE